MAPEMEPKKSSAGLILGLASSAVGGFQQADAFSSDKYLKMGTDLNIDYGG